MASKTSRRSISSSQLTQSQQADGSRESIEHKLNEINSKKSETASNPSNKVINMLKLYKNVLTKMQPSSEASPAKKSTSAATFTSKTCHLIHKPFACVRTNPANTSSLGSARDGNESTSTISAVGYFR
jgi:hypothetical protein